MRADLEYDFEQELEHSPENIEAAVDMYDRLTFMGFTQHELCERMDKFLTREIERKRHEARSNNRSGKTPGDVSQAE